MPREACAGKSEWAGSDESAEANSAAEKRANKQKMMEAKGGDE